MRHSRTRLAMLAAALCLGVATTHPARADESDSSTEDGAAIEALQSQGFDLSEPQLVEFMFSFQLAQNARQLGTALASEGFRSKLETDGKDVLLLARKRVVLNAQDISALRARFETLAKSAGGQYEGWGIP